MAKPSSFRAVIALWLSPALMASDLSKVTGLPATEIAPLVNKWKSRDKIPSPWWDSILRTRVAKVAALTAKDFVRLDAIALPAPRAAAAGARA